MSAPANFKQSALTRAMKAATAAGLNISRTEIAPDGTIRLVHGEAPEAPMSAFDEWKAKQRARSA